MMEASAEGHESMEICPEKDHVLQCDQQFKDVGLNGLESNFNGKESELNNINGSVSLEQKNEDRELRPPPKEILPVLVAVWTKMSPEIRHAYKIFRELLNEKNKSIVEPFLDAVDATVPGLSDYYEQIKEPVNLFQISEKFHNMQYTSITQMAADLRQMIENCYRYNGVDSYVSKQAYKLEVILEQKLALLSRELRDKTSIAATNIIKDKEYLNGLLFTSGGRRLSRKPLNGESSLIALQIQLQDGVKEKEKKRQKEKVKKELNEALEGELEAWWDEISNSEPMKELISTWEVPSVGIFIFILKDVLNLQDLNYTEFELGTLFPDKSSFMAKIFTSLLVTPFQRLKLNKKEPMEYSVWESKVNTKVSSWYKMAASRGQENTASLFGFDPDLFEVLGYTNPFENLKFDQLSLKQRMWIMKALCEAALEQDSSMRDHFADLDFLDRQDLCLGSDSEGFSYHYFSAFGATDIRIYKQTAMAEPAIRKAKNQAIISLKQEPVVKKDPASKEPSTTKTSKEPTAKASIEASTVKATEVMESPATRTSNRIRAKKSLSPQADKTTPVKKDKKPNKEQVKEFELIVSDIQSLSELVDKFSNTLKMKGKRRTVENELFQSLEALLVELEKREASLLKCSQKARLKIMRETRKQTEQPATQNEVKENPDGCWKSDDEEDDDEETEAVPTKTKPEIPKPEIPAQILKSSLQSCVAKESDVNHGALPLQTEILSKEGRHSRKKRFDVKQLFLDPEHPRKKPRTEAVKSPLSNEQRKVNGFAKRESSDISSQLSLSRGNDSKVGLKRQNISQVTINGVDTSTSGLACADMDGKKFKIEGNSVSIESSRHKLKHKKNKKQKKKFKEHHQLSETHDSNLIPSHEEVRLSEKKRRTIPQEQLKKESQSPKQKLSSKDDFCFSYDGLKALADIASLVQNDVPTRHDSSDINEVEKVSKSVETATVISLPVVFSRETAVVTSAEHTRSKASDNAVMSKTNNIQSASNSDTPQQKQCINNSSLTNILVNNNGSTISVSGKGKQVVFQWPKQRPNILRRSKSIIVVPTQTQPIVDKSIAKAELQKAVLSSTKDTSVITSCTTTATASVFSSQNQTNDNRTITSGDSSAQPVASSQFKVISQDGKYIVCSNLSNIPALKPLAIDTFTQNTNSADASSVAVSSQIPASKTISVTPQQQAKSATSVAETPQAQPIVIFSGTQTLIRPAFIGHQQIAIPNQLVTNGQPKQNIIIKQQGQHQLLAVRQQQPVASVPNFSGNILPVTSKDEAPTKCPVTTLKSKLHAAALKKRSSGKGKLESGLLPIIVPQPPPKLPLGPISPVDQGLPNDTKSKIQIVKSTSGSLKASDKVMQNVASSKTETLRSMSLPADFAKVESWLQQNFSNKLSENSTASTATVTATACLKTPCNVGTTVKSSSNPNGNYAPSQDNIPVTATVQRTKSIQIVESIKKERSKTTPKSLPKTTQDRVVIIASPKENASQKKGNQKAMVNKQSVSIIKQQPQVDSKIIKQLSQTAKPVVSIREQNYHVEKPTVFITRQHSQPIIPVASIGKQHLQPITPISSITKQYSQPVIPAGSMTKQHFQLVLPVASTIGQHSQTTIPVASMTNQHSQPMMPVLSITTQHSQPVFPVVSVATPNLQPIVPVASNTKQHSQPIMPFVSLTTQHSQPAMPVSSIIKQHFQQVMPSASIIKQHPQPVISALPVTVQNSQPIIPIISMPKQQGLPVMPSVSSMKQCPQPVSHVVSLMTQPLMPVATVAKQHSPPTVPIVSITTQPSQPLTPVASITKQHSQPVMPILSITTQHCQPVMSIPSTVKQQSQPVTPNVSVKKQQSRAVAPDVSIPTQHYQLVMPVSLTSQQTQLAMPVGSLVKLHPDSITPNGSISTPHSQQTMPVASITKQHSKTALSSASIIKQHPQPKMSALSIAKQNSEQVPSSLSQHTKVKIPGPSVAKQPSQAATPVGSNLKQQPQSLMPNFSVANQCSQMVSPSVSIKHIPQPIVPIVSQSSNFGQHQPHTEQPNVPIVKKHPLPANTPVPNTIQQIAQPIQSKIQNIKPNSTIYITPARFAFGGVYQTAVPIAPMPTQVLKMPNGLPIAVSSSVDMKLDDTSSKAVASHQTVVPIAPMPTQVLKMPNGLPIAVSSSVDMKLNDTSSKAVTSHVVLLPHTVPANQSKLIVSSDVRQPPNISKRSADELPKQKKVPSSSSSPTCSIEQLNAENIFPSADELIKRITISSSSPIMPTFKQSLQPEYSNAGTICLQTINSSDACGDKPTSSSSSSISDVVSNSADWPQKAAIVSTAMDPPTDKDNIGSHETAVPSCTTNNSETVTKDCTDPCLNVDNSTVKSSSVVQNNKDAAAVVSDHSFVTFSVVSPIPHTELSSTNN